ncbi:hypothetical protein ACKWTF_008407 [Chironomus riparius]
MSINIFKAKTEFKSDVKSNEYRLIGNNYFKNKHWFRSLLYFNKSIAYAHSKRALALGYGNRSAVYYHTNLFEECLENIQLARDNGYAEQSKLDTREANCKQFMAKPKDEKSENLWDFFKLSYPANEKIPWLVDCVEMRRTKKYGRGIYAKQNLKAGDIICVEEPLLHYTKGENGYYHCYNCFKAHKMNLIHCDHTASIMFCSTACKEHFNSKAINEKEIVSADVKILSDVSEFFGGYKQFNDYINRTDLKKLNKSLFDYDFSDPTDPKYEENRMNCLLSLCTNKLPIEILSSIEKYISKKAVHHLLSLFWINSKNSALFDGKGIKFNTGFYVSLFTSLINHACIGNAHIFVVEGKVITMIEKPVKAGDQIFECYPGCALIFNRSLKKDLEDQHLFNCDCHACVRSGFMNMADFKTGFTQAMKIDPTPIYQQNYKVIKKTLQEARDDINDNPEDHKILSNSLIYTVTYMEAIGFQCMYPF